MKEVTRSVLPFGRTRNETKGLCRNVPESHPSTPLHINDVSSPASSWGVISRGRCREIHMPDKSSKTAQKEITRIRNTETMLKILSYFVHKRRSPFLKLSCTSLPREAQSCMSAGNLALARPVFVFFGGLPFYTRIHRNPKRRMPKRKKHKELLEIENNRLETQTDCCGLQPSRTSSFRAQCEGRYWLVLLLPFVRNLNKRGICKYKKSRQPRRT